MNSPTQIIASAIELYSYLMLASVLMSWLPIDPDHPAVRALHSLTEPMLDPIRRALGGGVGGLDFSPMIALIILQFLAGYVRSLG